MIEDLIPFLATFYPYTPRWQKVLLMLFNYAQFFAVIFLIGLFFGLGWKLA